MSKPSVTIHDVAEAAGVSVSTVSRVLNNKDDVASSTQARVQSVIDDLGYSSTLAAISMRRKKTNVIGAVIFELSDPFSVEIIKGLGEAIRASDYDIIMYSSGRNPSSVAELEREYVAKLNGSITDGMILVAPANTQITSAAPLVVIDPLVNGSVLPSVQADNRSGALAAMNYLTGLGHRRIGFIGGRDGLCSSHERHEGYLAGLSQAGIASDPALQQTGDFTRESGQLGAEQLLALTEAPTAIFAANDQTALGVYDASAAAGMRIPADLSVVGFDNTGEGQHANPPLTTVDQSIGEMTRAAAAMLIQVIEKQPLAQTALRIPTRLVIRHSCQAVQRKIADC